METTPKTNRFERVSYTLFGMIVGMLAIMIAISVWPKAETIANLTMIGCAVLCAIGAFLPSGKPKKALNQLSVEKIAKISEKMDDYSMGKLEDTARVLLEDQKAKPFEKFMKRLSAEWNNDKNFYIPLVFDITIIGGMIYSRVPNLLFLAGIYLGITILRSIFLLITGAFYAPF